MNLLSNIKGFVQKSLAALSLGWQRGDDMMDGATGARLSRPFAESAWVQRAIKRVSDPIAAVPLEFSEAEQVVNDARLAAFWERPAIDRSGPMGRADFISATVGWLKLTGESFWLLGDDWLITRRPSSPMIIARPDRMRPILENNQLAGWNFTDASGRQHMLVRDQVVHLKFWNPYDDLRGCSEYESARVAAESDYLAGRFALNLNRANGDRGVIVVAKGAMPSDEQKEQIVAALRAKAAAARNGVFKPLFLTGDVSVEDPKVSAPDASFVAARLSNRHEIALAFGVPPEMFDVKASYSEGASSARYLLIVDTCVPLGVKICDGVEMVSARFLGRAVKAGFNWDDHDVMQAARRQRFAGVPTLWATGVPMQIINDALGLKLPAFPGWDKGYLPFSVQEVGAEMELPDSDEAPALPPPTDDEDAVTLMVRAIESADPLTIMQRALEAPVQIGARAQKSAARANLWRSHMKTRQKSVKRYAAKFSKVLMGARAEVLRKIESKGPKVLAVETKAAAAEFLFDLGRFSASLKAEMRKAALATITDAGAELFKEIGKDDVFTMPPGRVADFIRDRENKLSDVSDDVFERVRAELQAGIDAGDSTADLAARIKSEFNGIDDGRAMTIAQTETSAAYGYSRQDAMDQSGIEWKEWLTSGLDTVRSTHLEAEGQRVAVNDPFEIGAARLFFPGDPQGPPEEVINCHCVSIPVATKED